MSHLSLPHSSSDKTSTKNRAAKIYAALEKAYPDAGPELRFRNPFELLVAVVLSAQCTDTRVNMVTPALFERFPTPQKMAEASPEEIEPFIRSCGLYRNKARNLAALSKAIVQKLNGEVPILRDDLSHLPGVGQKTAGVVSMHLNGDAAFPVDTHVKRLSSRMGLSDAKTPEGVERDLQRLFPKENWQRGHHLFIWHGRRCCTARSPACTACPVRESCPSAK